MVLAYEQLFLNKLFDFFLLVCTKKKEINKLAKKLGKTKKKETCHGKLARAQPALSSLHMTT